MSINYVNTENKVFNMCGNKTISLTEMVEDIQEILGKKVKLNRLPMQPSDVNRTCNYIAYSK